MTVTLFDPIKVGALTLPNRVVFAPCTRCRAVDRRIPNELMLEYYVQRSSVGLILTEATSVTPMGVGYANTPGIWSQEQIQGWKAITDAVHKVGGKIVLQLWHVGRISSPEFLDGKLPVAPSAIKPRGDKYVTPRALELDEIPGVVESYVQGAKNAKIAGFDGVEIHGANGYLLDQFLQDSTNKRTDRYGGSIENRARLMLEVTDGIIEVWGADRVGMHLSPRGDASDMGDSDPVKTFTYVASELSKRKIAFLFVREYQGKDSIGHLLRDAFKGVYIANEQLTKETAESILADNAADAVSFGRDIIANPDLVFRFKKNAPLNKADESTFYFGGAKGYTDYKAL